MKLKNFLLPLCLALGFLCTGCPAPCDANDQEVLLIRNELAWIVEALEVYKNERKTYPERLDELYPPHATMDDRAGGRKISYQRISENEYNLRVHSRDGGSYSGSCSASEIEEKWKELNKNR